MRSPRTATKSSPCLPQLEKARVQHQRLNAAKNKFIKKQKTMNDLNRPKIAPQSCSGSRLRARWPWGTGQKPSQVLQGPPAPGLWCGAPCAVAAGADLPSW